MAIRFITGKTETGKTSQMYRRVIEASTHEQQLLIVPEQSTLDVQHKMIEHHPNHCITNIEVLSFGRLAHRMIDELGIAGRTVISDVGKNMMIRGIIGDQAEAFPFLSRHIHKKGYINELRGLMSEFSRYTIEHEDFDLLMDQIDDPLLLSKLEDCKDLYSQYSQAVNQQYFSGDSMMDLLIKAAPNSEFLKHSNIYIDGFYGYTPIQYALIERLMTTASNVTIAITIDNDLLQQQRLNENHLYYESHETYNRLMAMVNDHSHLSIEQIKLDNSIENQTFEHLKNALYQYPYKVYNQPIKGVFLSKVSSITREVAYVRDSILKLVMEKGYRYSDIAVLAGDVGRYDKVLTLSFGQGQIPHYIDRKKSILTNDVAALVMNMVKMMQYDMSYRYVFAYLKSGYFECDQSLLDYLENYVIRYGIRGMSSWRKQWVLKVPDLHMEPDAPVALSILKQINVLKALALEPFSTYKEKKAKSISAHVKALFELFEAIDLEGKISNKATVYENDGKLNLYREYNQIYRVIIDMLDQLHDIGSDEVVDFEQFADLLEAGFEQIELGNVPARLDEVLVGDLTRTRLSKKKAVFIIGINEGLVPKLVDGTSLITDQERDMMEGKGFKLAPSARKSLFRDQFYIYLKLFRAKERLYLSYSMMDDEGSVSRAAHLIHMIKKILPSLKEVDIDQLYDDRIVINRPEAVYEHLIKALQNHEEGDVHQLKEWFMQADGYEGSIEKALSGRTHHLKHDRLSAKTTDKLYGDTLLNSVSRLEQFSKCPFAHFAMYGLKAKEREAYEITMPQLGLVFHRVIELFSKRVIDRQLPWSDITKAIRKAWVNEMVDATIDQDVHLVFFDSQRNRYRIGRLKTILEQTLKVIGHQISQGVFEPVSAEWQFKGDDTSIEALNVPLDNDKSMCLLGTIDRVDMFDDGHMKYVTIVDYKSSNQDFDLGDMYHGLQLQLIVYLNAAVEVTASKSDKDVKPAGVFYFKIDDPFIDGNDTMSDQGIEKDILKKFRLKGVVLEDEKIISKLDQHFSKESTVIPVKRNANGSLSKSSKTVTEEDLEVIRTYISNKTKELGNCIVGGQIDPHPFKKKEQTACDYCDYKSVCGFDQKLPSHDYNSLSKDGDESYIELMKE